MYSIRLCVIVNDFQLIVVIMMNLVGFRDAFEVAWLLIILEEEFITFA